MKILIIDDDKLIRETYQTVLTTHGYHVEVAENLPSTQKILKTFSPDYILLDLIMHPHNGWIILEKIQQHQIWQNFPVIIFSGKIVYVHEILMYGGQTVGYVKKPARPADIIKEITRIEACTKEWNSYKQKAIESEFSSDEISKYAHIMFSIPVLERLTESLLNNFKGFYRDDERNQMMDDPDFLKLCTSIDEQKQMLNMYLDKLR